MPNATQLATVKAPTTPRTYVPIPTLCTSALTVGVE